MQILNYLMILIINTNNNANNYKNNNKNNNRNNNENNNRNNYKNNNRKKETFEDNSKSVMEKMEDAKPFDELSNENIEPSNPKLLEFVLKYLINLVLMVEK